MTEYRYTDHVGEELSVWPDTPAGVYVQVSDYDGVSIPVADVPGMIRGILAQAAAAQGHDGDPLAQACADIAAVDADTRTIAEVEARDAAVDRVLDTHAPLLYALAAAYLGDDAPIWAELRRVQRERDNARREADRRREQWDQIVRTLDRITNERDQARTANEQACNRAQYACDAVDKATETVQRLTNELANAHAENERLHTELAEMSETLGENVGQALIDKTMLKALNVVDGQVQLDIEPARELLLTWCAAVRAMLDHHGAENYTETEITAPREAVSMDIQDGQHNTDSYTLTLQRRFRPTPHEMRQRAERDLTAIRRTVAEWIHAANSGDDRNASDLMWELEQAGVPLTAELDAIEAERTQAAEDTPA